MGRTIGSAGDWLRRCLYASQLLALLAVLFVVAPFDNLASVALAVLFAALLVAVAVGLWRREAGDDGTRSGTVADITYDPFADPGQMARDRWERAIRRLPGGDDDGD